MFRSLVAALGLALSLLTLPVLAQEPAQSNDPRAAAVFAALPASFGSFTTTPGTDYAADSTDVATGAKSVSLIRIYSSGADMLTVSAVISTAEAIAAQANIMTSPDSLSMQGGKLVEIEGALAVSYPGAGLNIYPGHPAGSVYLMIGGMPEAEWETLAKAIDMKALAAIN